MWSVVNTLYNFTPQVEKTVDNDEIVDSYKQFAIAISEGFTQARTTLCTPAMLLH